jgi:hypothetical protein
MSRLIPVLMHNMARMRGWGGGVFGGWGVQRKGCIVVVWRRDSLTVRLIPVLMHKMVSLDDCELAFADMLSTTSPRRCTFHTPFFMRLVPGSVSFLPQTMQREPGSLSTTQCTPPSPLYN